MQSCSNMRTSSQTRQTKPGILSKRISASWTSRTTGTTNYTKRRWRSSKMQSQSLAWVKAATLSSTITSTTWPIPSNRARSSLSRWTCSLSASWSQWITQPLITMNWSHLQNHSRDYTIHNWKTLERNALLQWFAQSFRLVIAIRSRLVWILDCRSM